MPGSTIINTASINSYDPSPKMLDYASTKGAILIFTKDLAKQLEIDLAGLSATIEPLGPVLELAPGGAAPAEGLLPPLHAIRVTGARRATLGGLAVDASAHVLDAMGKPIPGLYATTATAAALGGIAAANLAGLSALTSLGLARLAALDLVASLPPEAA